MQTFCSEYSSITVPSTFPLSRAFKLSLGVPNPPGAFHHYHNANNQQTRQTKGSEQNKPSQLCWDSGKHWERRWQVDCGSVPVSLRRVEGACSLFPHLPLQQESRGWCFSQPQCVCEEGGRPLWDSGAAPRQSQLCQTPPGSSLPGHPHPLQLRVTEVMLSHVLCQTGTYREGREWTLLTLWQADSSGPVCLG